LKKLLYILLTVTFIGCSDSPENEVNNISIVVVDKWYLIKTVYYENNVLDDIEETKEIEVNGCRSYYEFKSDGTSEHTIVLSDCSGLDLQQFGTWELINNSNTLSIGHNSGRTIEWEILDFNEDNLTIQFEQGFQKFITYLEKDY